MTYLDEVAQASFQTPVVFFIFNRPDKTAEVLDAIRSVAPPLLFVVADGPRPGVAADAESCKATRAVINTVDWPCNIRRLFSDVNMGLKARIETGTDWVFQSVDRAIFLEDDTVVHPDYFYFSQRMLEKYKNDSRVSGIQAFCGAPADVFDEAYCFSVFHHPWGRAFWRRSWEANDRDMSNLNWVLEKQILKSVFPIDGARKYWEKGLVDAKKGLHKSWSFPFNLSCWLQGGLSIVPCRNLVRNAGVGLEATNTRVNDGQATVAVSALPKDLADPEILIANWRYEQEIARRYHHLPSLLKRIEWKARITVSELNRAIVKA